MSGARTGTVVSRHTAAIVLTVSLFGLWGFGHQFYDTLLPQIAAVFGLRRFELALTQSVYSIVYFIGAIPAAVYARRFGYKATILFGLGSFCIGVFILYPATETRSFDYFAFAVSVMACGWILLEIAANPLVAGFGNAETAVARLNAAQSFYPIGGLLGLYVGRWIVHANLTMPAARLAHAIVHPYIVLGVLVMVLAFLIDEAKFPPIATEQTKRLSGALRDLRLLLARPLILFAIVAQFCSVLALAGTWSLNSAYMSAAFPAVPPSAYADVFVWSFTLFGIGRIAGTALMFRFAPDRVLAVFSIGGLVLSGIAAVYGGPPGAVAMIASSFFLSITWPSILGIAIGGTSSLMKLGTALICMGGALGGFAYQMLAVSVSFPAVHYGMTIPALCYVVVLAFAIVSGRLRQSG
jgi:MFS transporter, FHS family, L-fucose permease